MADGRKNNRGTIGNKGGRPPKADEIAVIEQMDAIAVPERAWRNLWALVEQGDIQAMKTWLAYRFGQPKQSTDITSNGNTIAVAPIKWADE
jgi:hypothetical protein